MTKTEILAEIGEALRGSRTLIITVSKDAGKEFALHITHCSSEHDLLVLPDHALWVFAKAISYNHFDNSHSFRLILSPKYEEKNVDWLPPEICAQIDDIIVPPRPEVRIHL